MKHKRLRSYISKWSHDRTAYLLNFAVLYFALALLLIVSSVLFALWFAERLSKPIGRLALLQLQSELGAGELTTQVIEDEGDDEISRSLVVILIK